jgi:surface antigen
MKKTTLLLTALLWAMMGYAAARAQEYGGSMGTLQTALENNRTNQASTWVNPDTGGTGMVAPVRTFQNAGGEPCREFQQKIVVGGEEVQGYGTACRQPDGTWRIVSGETGASPAVPVEKRTTVYVREAARPYYYDPYGYYAPWGYGYYGYPYWYPLNFALSLGYVYYDGGHRHGGHHHKYYGGGHKGSYYGGGHKGKYYGGGHKGSHSGGKYRGGGHRR